MVFIPSFVLQLDMMGVATLPLASLSRDVVNFVEPVAANEVPLLHLPFRACGVLECLTYAATMEQAEVAGVFIFEDKLPETRIRG